MALSSGIIIGPCSECRFWKDLEEWRSYFGIRPRPDYKECARVRDHDNLAHVIAEGSDDDALMTRSDFGCVQWERK